MNDSAAPLALPTIRALLSGAIDYAGLFPPASLDLATVVAQYRAYRAGPDAWALGRLVIPAAQLTSLAAAMDTGRRADAEGAAGRGPWRISALAGVETADDAEQIVRFNSARADHAVVDCVETRAASPEEVHALDGVFGSLSLFVEVPLRADLPPLVRAVRSIGAMAKVRTGGVTVEAFPDPRDVARFLRACAAADVAFKATAGLHHPWRGTYRLTYEPGGPCGVMFGYLNVLLAALRALAGADEADLVRTLDARRHDGLHIDAHEIRWAGARATTADITSLRQRFAIGIGSCSFREPLDDLGTLFAA